MNIGDVVVHKNEGLVKLIRVDTITRDGVETPYYVFVPFYSKKENDTIMLPNTALPLRTRTLMSIDSANKIIESIRNFNLANWDDNNKTRKQAFDLILNNGNSNEISKMIYLIKRKEKELKGTKKTISKFDGDALNRAEKILFSELAYILNVNVDEIEKFYSSSIVI